MADTSEPQATPKNHPLLEALQDETFRDALADAITKPLGDDRDAEITALLKSKGLDSMTEEQILSILNPPVTDSDPTKQPGQDGGAKPSAPPFAFSFALYEARYTITSASHPDGVFEIQVGGDGTVTMGEDGNAYKATPELDSSNNWWLRWGDKAAGDWFSVQFFSVIPQSGDDKTPSLTFKGIWHTKKDGKAVDLDIAGKYNHVARKDTSEKVAKNFKYGAVALITWYLTVGVIMHFMQRRLRRRGAAAEENAERQRLAEVVAANQARLVEEQARAQDQRGNDVAQEYFKNLGQEKFASFETILTEHMKKVVEDYYREPGHNDRWVDQRGQPPNDAIQEGIKKVISENVKGLITQTQGAIAESFNSEFRERLPADVKERLAREVEGKIEKHAIDTLMTPEGAYKGLAKLAFDRVTTLSYAEYVRAQKGAALSVAMDGVRSMRGDAHDGVFRQLVNLAEDLYEARLEGRAEQLIEQRKERLLTELERLEQQLGQEHEGLKDVKGLLVEEGTVMAEFREAGEDLRRLDEHEKMERRNAEHAMRNLRH